MNWFPFAGKGHTRFIILLQLLGLDNAAVVSPDAVSSTDIRLHPQRVNQCRTKNQLQRFPVSLHLLAR